MSGVVKDMLLSGWEEMYKKSQLTLWILLALKDGEKGMVHIKSFMEERSNKTISADDQSMYRALRRFDEADLIKSRNAPSAGGPDIKLWHLTPTGEWVLEAFIQKHVRGVFLHSQNRNLFG